MSEIDLSHITPMEPHLRKICTEVIKLDGDQEITNTEHFTNVCKLLTVRMKENDAIFKKLFKCVELAGSYADTLKISVPNEYDALIILNFHNPHVKLSRPGYVTINIEDAIQEGWDDYNVFVDEEGYLIQNKVLNWLRDLIRSTLSMNGNFDDYEIDQYSSGPAVTLTVAVQDCEFNIDLVGALAFHTDKWWVADKGRSYSGFWNAIPKPIKVNALPAAENIFPDSQNINPKPKQFNKKKSIKSKETDLCNTSNPVVQQKNINEGKKIPAGIRYSNPKKAKIIEDAENVNTVNAKIIPSSGHWFRKPKKRVNEEQQQSATSVLFMENSNVKAKIPAVGARNGNIKRLNANNEKHSPSRNWYRKPKKIMLNAQEQTMQPAVNFRYKKPEKCNVDGKAKVPVAGIRYRKPKRPTVKGGPEVLASEVKVEKSTKKNAKKLTSNVPPNPQKNREWICSYAQIERNFLRGTQNMKPLIRIFKKIRDNKQLTNLKSYYIKTIFLHQNVKKGSDYWQQSLAVLFMEMFDVILEHLRQHRLASFWHNDFNLFHHYRPEQINAIYENLLKTKNDIVSNLLDHNPEFIYEVICTRTISVINLRKYQTLKSNENKKVVLKKFLTCSKRTKGYFNFRV